MTSSETEKAIAAREKASREAWAKRYPDRVAPADEEKPKATKAKS